MNMPRQEGWPAPTERTEDEAADIAGQIQWGLKHHPNPTREQLMAFIGFTRTTYHQHERPYTPPAVIGKD